MRWSKRRIIQDLQGRLQELTEQYWQQSSEMMDLRIDKENLERKMEQIQAMPRPQEKVR
jgi:FtsZ-binding cell division protein ZapB